MRSRTPLIALLGASAIIITGCSATPGSPDDQSDAPLADGKTFTMVIADDAGNLDPIAASFTSARLLDRFLYASLIGITEDGALQSALAESWKSDGSTATFVVRDDVTCDDGTPLTASDVAASIAAYVDPANASNLLGRNILPGSSASADDATRTVTVVSGVPDPFLVENVGTLPIVCSTVLGDPEARAKGEGATGMFRMEEISPNNQYTLTRREEFTWGPGDWDPSQKGLPDEVVFRVIPSETTATSLLLTGEVNAAAVRGPDRRRLIDADLFSTTTLAPVGRLLFNQSEGRPTADLDVRRALVQALDLAQLRQVVADGDGTAPTSLVTDNPNPCRLDVVDGSFPEFDAKAAAEALDDAGWKAGDDGIRERDGVRLSLKVLNAAAFGDGGNAASELILTFWTAIGVEVDLRSADAAGLNEAMFASGDWDVSTLGPGGSLPTHLVPLYSGAVPPNGTNMAHITAEGYDEAVAVAMTKVGTDGCSDWAAAEKALLDDIAVVPYADTPNRTFGSKATWVEGEGIDPTSIRMYQ